MFLNQKNGFLPIPVQSRMSFSSKKRDPTDEYKDYFFISFYFISFITFNMSASGVEHTLVKPWLALLVIN